MKKLLLFLFISTICTAQIKDFFKYSTFYTSVTTGTSFIERENYIAIDKGYEDITKINAYDYTVLKKPLQIMLLLVMLMVGSIYLIIHLYGIAVISLLSRISGLDILEMDLWQKHNIQIIKE